MKPSKMGKSYVRDYTEDELRSIAENLEVAVTVPVQVEVEFDHRVLDLSEIENMLRSAKRIVLQNCGCRQDKNNCSNPKDVCLMIDPKDDYLEVNKAYSPRLVTLNQAVDALKRSHEAGLVHMAYTGKGDERPSLICSCCSCCCHTLGGLLRYGISTKVLTSKLIANDDMNCIDCGKCVERCVFEARSMESGKKVYLNEKCFGCGLCVSTCPVGAITLKPRV
jgi:Pyruvate/2-oxoacid:ferredoxin oxidoreductase delta subunit